MPPRLLLPLLLLATAVAHLTIPPARAAETPGPDRPRAEIVGQPRFYQHADAAVEGVGADEQELYQAHFYGAFGVTVRGLRPAGRYRVVLGNAELSANGPDYRVFGVRLNGEVVAPAVNLNGQFGFGKRADLTFPATATDAGEIVLELLEVPGRNAPRLSFLRVLEADAERVVAETRALSVRPPGWENFQTLGLDAAKLDLTTPEPPWPGTYKLRPDETARLTAADVPGPDGLVYPDFRHAGIPGGIPAVPVVAKVETFGAKPDDDGDDADALERGAAAVGARGGGALLLAAGTYHLDRPVMITADGVVLRGAGAGKTRLVFRYAGPAPGTVEFLHPEPGASFDANTWVEVHAAPKDLREIRVSFDNAPAASGASTGKYYPEHWGGNFSMRGAGSRFLVPEVPAGPQTLRAVATYADGRRVERTLEVLVSTDPPKAPAQIPWEIAAVMFAGAGPVGARLPLVRDGERGDQHLSLRPGHNLRAGDRIGLRAPATERWNKLVRNLCPWGEYRATQLVVAAVEADGRVRVNQPLRIPFPVVDGAFAQRLKPIARCGVEDLTLEQTREIWTSGIVFSHAWECWARGVHVQKAGRFPLYFLPAKWCEVRDGRFDDAWYKGGGGTAYIGWEYAYDCLMDNVQTSKLRHAPQVQWSAAGNVIRNGVFEDSDAQWHSGWTHENLFENCVVRSRTGNGSYGFGMWASPPEDTAHGPNGPRNVVWNCDVSSPRAGLWMGGMNEGWIIAYNRFEVGSGPAVVAKTASFDHSIRGNVFTLRKPKPAAVFLATPDCRGVELVGNTVWTPTGQLKLVDGPAAGSATDRDNAVRKLPPADAGQPPPDRPRPPVPSLFDWQRQHAPPLVPVAAK